MKKAPAGSSESLGEHWDLCCACRGQAYQTYAILEILKKMKGM